MWSIKFFISNRLYSIANISQKQDYSTVIFFSTVNKTWIIFLVFSAHFSTRKNVLYVRGTRSTNLESTPLKWKKQQSKSAKKNGFLLPEIWGLSKVLERFQVSRGFSVYGRCEGFRFLNVFKCVWKSWTTFENVSIWNWNVPGSETVFERFWTFWVRSV